MSKRTHVDPPYLVSQESDKTQWGIFEWQNMNGERGRGYVVRETRDGIGAYAPYHAQTPIKIYHFRNRAEAFADKLNKEGTR